MSVPAGIVSFSFPRRHFLKLLTQALGRQEFHDVSPADIYLLFK